jgi:hypothetical protein
MEFILEIIFQLFLELIFAGIEHLFKRRKTPEESPSSEINITRPTQFLIAFLHLIGGGMIGWLSLYVWPEHLLQSDLSRAGLLILGPVLVGLVMHLIAKRRVTLGKQVVSFENFYNGFAFALGISLTRFLFAI